MNELHVFLVASAVAIKAHAWLATVTGCAALGILYSISKVPSDRRNAAAAMVRHESKQPQLPRR